MQTAEDWLPKKTDGKILKIGRQGTDSRPSAVRVKPQLHIHDFGHGRATRLISVVDVVIRPMNPYQPIPFHILSFAVFQSRILIYAGSNDSRRRKGI